MRGRGSSFGRALDSDAHNPGSSPGDNVPFVQVVPAFHPVVDILGNQRRVHLLPCLCGMGCKRSLEVVLGMGVRVSVYLIIIIIRLYIAINELMRHKTVFNLNLL